MLSKNRIIRLIACLMILTLSLFACNLEVDSPTEEAIPAEDTPTLEPSAGISLPTDLAVIDSPSLIFIDFQNATDGWGISENEGGNLLRTQDGGLTWLSVMPPDLTGVPYSTRLTILDVNTVWALIPSEDFLSGTLYHTSDGGASWTSNPVPFSGADIQFLDAQIGRAMADRGAGAGSNAVEIYHTSDGGLTWTSVFHNDPTQPGSSESLPLGGMKSGMTFLDTNSGWITGSRPMEGDIYLYQTRDGGRSWAMQPISLPPGLASCQFSTSPPFYFGQEGFLPMLVHRPTGDPVQAFYRTHDGGLTWIVDPSLVDTEYLPPGQFSFPDAVHGFFWNGSNNLLFTRDGAQSWTGKIPSIDISESLAAIEFIDGRTGWALTNPYSGMASLFQTTDGGATWTQLIP